MPRLAGKTAIVTGGAKGIGRHYSQALAAEGARVMIADFDALKLVRAVYRLLEERDAAGRELSSGPSN